MNDEPNHGGETISAGNGNRAKWLFGAVTALLLLGGGYFVWTSAMQGQESAEVATDDPYAEDPLRAETLRPAGDTFADSAPTDVGAASGEAPARRRAPRAAAIPEETIGITPASAAVEESEEIVVTARRPIWARTPSPRRLSALYPERAMERGREGEARLHCIVQAGGTLDCERLSESPGGFGPAALRVARTLRHAPRLPDGADAVGTPVRLRVVFRMADDDRRGRS